MFINFYKNIMLNESTLLSHGFSGKINFLFAYEDQDSNSDFNKSLVDKLE